MASVRNFGASHTREASTRCQFSSCVLIYVHLTHLHRNATPRAFLFAFRTSFTRHYLYFIKMFWYFVGIAVISAIVILHRSKTVGESDSDSEWEAEPGQILNADVYNPFARFNS